MKREGGNEKGREERGEGGRERYELTSDALLCRRDSSGIRGGLVGETGGEIERSWTLAGLEKEDESAVRWLCPT